MTTIDFSLPSERRRTTKIVVESKAIIALPSLLETISGDRVVILYDRHVRKIADTVARVCQERDPLLLAVGSGDASKSLSEVERITHRMLQARCTRSTILIAVGGGMITDLGGFIGSIFMRGISTVLVPTSILAMVDAAVGGKTAVNVRKRKNIIGTMCQPSLVVCDTDVVRALPLKLFVEGFVEVVKIAAITHRPFFLWLEKNLSRVLERDDRELAECIVRSIDAKLRVVKKDMHDASLRLHLNFGHTIGHALEAVSSFSLSHAEAVAIGMVLEMRAAHTKDAHRIHALLSRLSLPLDMPQKLRKIPLLWRAMQNDKKNIGSSVRIAVPTTIGQGMITTLTLQRFLAIIS